VADSKYRDVGAVSAVNFHIILRSNGAFYGLYTYTENDDNDYLTVPTRLSLPQFHPCTWSHRRQTILSVFLAPAIFLDSSSWGSILA